ncbi:MAG: EAL domain-containing protein [Burkholderiales bacterium]
MSLRARILLLVLAATLMPVLAMTWLLFQQRDLDVAQAREQLASIAEGLAEDLEYRIAGTSQLLYGLGRVPMLASGTKEQCSSFLADVLREHPQYTGILTILPDGELHCDSLRSGRVLQLSDRGYFKRALASDKHVVEPVFGRLTGIAVLQIAYAVRDGEGQSQYVLLASLNLDQFAQAGNTALPHAGTVFRIWDAKGRILVRSPPAGKNQLGKPYPDVEVNQRVLAPGLGHSVTFAAAGGAQIWSAAALPRTRDTGLRLTLDIPTAQLSQAADRQFLEALLLLAALSVAIVAAAIALAEYSVRRQAARLVQAVARIDAGDLGTRIGAPYPRGELGEVMAALDRTASSLETQREEIRRYNEKLVSQASHDALTGLANRNLLADRLHQTLVHAGRTGRMAAVLLLDLDRFKTVNDSLGHKVGDEMLQEVSSRLTGCVRDGDTVARLGGDEFVVVLSDLARIADAVPVAEKVLAAIAAPLAVGGREFVGSASIGISGFPHDGRDADTLLRNADVAMYRAKAEGGNRHAFFTQEMNARVLERLEIEAGLRRAIERDELVLHYQPIVDARSRRITSAEALVRWQHPERGLIPPGRFISVAEESGLIVLVGAWVLYAVCSQVAAWRRAGLDGLRVAVNLSGRQFAEQDLAQTVGNLLQRTGCPAGSLELEITESMIMRNPDAALHTMHRIDNLGVSLSIDDFGTGYSSLSYLKRFPVSKLKIDRSFVRDIHLDADDATIVEAIAALAKKLELGIVAEGVETEEQLEYLVSLGCDECQGFLFSRPVPAAEFAALLRADPAGQARQHAAGEIT